MAKAKYVSRIGKASVRTTSNGGRYVRPFDVIRSDSGRAAVRSHASAARENARSSDTSPDDKGRDLSGRDDRRTR